MAHDTGTEIAALKTILEVLVAHMPDTVRPAIIAAIRQQEERAAADAVPDIAKALAAMRQGIEDHLAERSDAGSGSATAPN